MTLKERKDTDDSEDDSELDLLEVDDWERPDDWERVALDELPESNADGYPIPEPDELTEEPASES